MTRTSRLQADGVWRQLLVAVLLAVALPQAMAAIPLSERAVLVALYNQTAGASWNANAGWSSPTTGVAGTPGFECTWLGVTCDAGQNHVTGLYLQASDTSGNNLAGTLPSLDALPALQFFVAGRNFLTGPIPALTALPALQIFVVNYNQLSGSLPSLSGLTGLQAFYADHNQLSGNIPPLAGLTALQEFFVNNNGLTGPLPALAGLGAVRVFVTSVNQLSGGIPSLTGLSALRFINVSENQLTGPLPPLAGLAALQYFGASENQLTGGIPPLAGLGALQGFQVQRNKLTGSIPALGGLTALGSFNVGDNQLTGSVPSLSGLTALQSFYAYLNQLTGPMALPPNPSVLQDGGSNICANQLESTGNAAADQAWDAASDMSPVLGSPGWLACQGFYFGKQILGTTSAPKTLTIAATAGSGVITITSILLTGDFAQTNNCGASLEPGQSCGIDVTFTPTTSGARAGELMLEGTVAAVGPVVASFPMRGTGIATCTLDVDGNGIQDALTDGLMIIRAAFGLTGASVTHAALGDAATRTDWVAIRAYLNDSCGANFQP
ncbi:MAG: choice-of-anchor D domain-containing protein [Betaproteobacteria bacterium]|nr:choice-of-anchor D domain-containing protein [Betaproteobacteria bacterium]